MISLPLGLHVRPSYPAGGAIVVLVQRPHPQPADVAGGVIARCDGMMGDNIGADEADFSVVGNFFGCWSLWPRYGSDLLCSRVCRRVAVFLLLRLVLVLVLVLASTARAARSSGIALGVTAITPPSSSTTALSSASSSPLPARSRSSSRARTAWHGRRGRRAGVSSLRSCVHLWLTMLSAAWMGNIEGSSSIAASSWYVGGRFNAERGGATWFGEIRSGGAN